MKYFIAIDEDLLQKLWMHDPSLVAPFSRPFYPRDLNQCCLRVNLEAKSILAESEITPQPDNSLISDPFRAVPASELIPIPGAVNDENIAHMEE